MGAALREFAPIDTGTSRRRSATSDGVTIAELRFEGGARLPRHAHELATLTVTLEGAFETALQARRYENPLHTVLAKPAGETHSNAFGNGGARLLMLSVDDASDEFCCCRQAFQSILHVVDVRAATLSLALAVELAAPDDLSPLALAGLSREVLALAARLREVRRELPQPLWLRRGLEFVRANPSSPIGLRQLSGICGVHPVYFARAFRANMGESLGSYARKLRVQRAATILGSSEEPIVSIALSLGFSDQSHLTRVFRAVTGYTPGGYRRLCRGS